MVQISFFRNVLGRFSKCSFEIFPCQPTMVAGKFTQVTMKKLPTALIEKLIYKMDNFIASGNCQEKQNNKDIEGTNLKILF